MHPGAGKTTRVIRPNDYFARIFCINLARRPDRWAHVEDQCRRYGLDVERFDAYDQIVFGGRVNGNWGCTSSHRALLELTAYHRWPRVLILEDDFEVCVPDFNERFDAMIREVPDDWDMLYLGGGYGEPPQYRHSPHVIRINRMLTTSSYGITAPMARRVAPYISGIGPIDSLYGGFHHDAKCYIFHPRLIVQYANVSDLQERHMDNSVSMLDSAHEEMLLHGEWLGPPSHGPSYFRSRVEKDQIGAAGDLNGRHVIVGRQLYMVVSVEGLPDHPPPWRRHEPCTYVLKPTAADSAS